MNEAVNPLPASADALAPPKSGHWSLAGRCAVVLLSLAIVWLFANRWSLWTGLATLQSTDDAYLESDVIPLAARVPGLVGAVLINDYQVVHRNDVLVQLFDSDYQAQVAQARAALDKSLAQVAVLEKQRAQQEASINASSAGVVAAAAAAQLRRLEADRQRDLFARGHFASQ